MKHIYYKSDFKVLFRVKDARGEYIDLSAGDWRATFWTATKGKTYCIGMTGGKPCGCEINERGEVVAALDNHSLPPGVLKCEIAMDFSDKDFADGIMTVVTPDALDVCLVATKEEIDVAEDFATEISVQLPALKGDKGEPFTYEDFDDEQIEGLKRPAVEAAIEVRELRDKAAVAEQGRVQSEQSRVSAESARECSEKERMIAETGRINAETGRAEAESRRATGFNAMQVQNAGAVERANDAAQYATAQGDYAKALGDGVADALAAKQPKLRVSDDLSLSADSLLSLTEMAKKRLFIDMWNNACSAHNKYACGRYNEDTGYFELNELTDITYAQAIAIYNRGNIVDIPGVYKSKLIAARTNLPPLNVPGTIKQSQMFFDNPYIEVARLATAYNNNWAYITGDVANNMFVACIKLRKVIGVMTCTQMAQKTITFFDRCYALEDFRIGKLVTSIDIHWSPLVNLESMQYLISKANEATHADVKADRVITVHPDVWAKIQDESNEEWHALLTDALEKNITFATV